MHRLLPALVGPMLLAAAAAAQPAAPPGWESRDYTACLDRAGGVTPAMIQCSGEETARWDRRLNAAYGTIQQDRRWSAGTKSLLREAQRAWIAYRDAACRAEGELEAEGGTLARIVAADCVARLTAGRAGELEQLLRDQARQ
ncbi:lysozyme inhibitor LprI family protein [Paracraurococcus lichenis]|uniref:Lysozyme inhibitor LprI family protein n=1 Tax=Paracraurococcus lichenis TaxID=3064888 RepID=A0ABT9E388_9PROT|nr:lysozyme inhibitor LprI family protein [Paracraurococcus sp. LOR1-02]MDO9710627.1 lysozyme inhibitor LprI family protein [Paracraurococcus sp. LOR1-02]